MGSEGGVGRKILLTFNESINGRMKKGGRESASVKVSVAAFYLFACLAIIRRAYRKGQLSVILRDQAKDPRRHVHWRVARLLAQVPLQGSMPFCNWTGTGVLQVESLAVRGGSSIQVQSNATSILSPALT